MNLLGRLKSLSPRVQKLLVAGILVGVVVVAVGVRMWYVFFRLKPQPTQLLCPIAPATVERPECVLYTGQKYRADTYRLLPAIELGRNEMGLYKNFEGELVVFADAGYNPYPAQYSVVYPQDVLLYKTERESNDPAKCPEHLTKYGLCDTPVDRVIFGNGIQGEVDLAISFTLKATSDNLEQLYDIGGLNRFVDLFKQVVRGNRQLTNIDAQIANTEEGSKQIEQAFRQVLEDWSLAHLFDLETITVRSVVVGSDSYRQQQDAQAARIAQQELEQQSLELKRQGLEFERNQRLQEAESFAKSIQTICQNIPPERCPDMVWVLMYGGQMQPFLSQGGRFSTPLPAQPAP